MKLTASARAGITRFTRRLLARDGLAVEVCEGCHARKLVVSVTGRCASCDERVRVWLDVLRADSALGHVTPGRGRQKKVAPPLALPGCGT